MNKSYTILLLFLTSCRQFIAMEQPETINPIKSMNVIKNNTNETVYVSVFVELLKNGLVYQKTIKLDKGSQQAFNLDNNYDSTNRFHIIVWTIYPHISTIFPFQKQKNPLPVRFIINKTNNILTMTTQSIQP